MVDRPTSDSDAGAGLPGSYRALLIPNGSLSAWLPAVVRLLRQEEVESVVVRLPLGDVDPGDLPSDPRLVMAPHVGFGDLLRAQADETPLPVLVMSSPALVPLQGIGPALAILRADARVALVSFLCNAAGHLSFPHRNGPTPYATEGYDETSLSRRLRESSPTLEPVPIAATAGPATLVSRDAVVVTGGPDGAFDGAPEVSLAELGLRATRRGLRTLLDPSTFVLRPFELDPWGPEPLTDPTTRHALETRHHFFPALYDSDRSDGSAPLSIAMDTARAKIRGLRILVDASCLGPIENGTQVQTLALVEALARRDDVQWVGVGVPGDVPRYAHRVLQHPKTRTIVNPSLTFEGAPYADIVHRPFQADQPLPWGRWREVAGRALLTVQDLISYGIGAYHNDGGSWLSYRAAMAHAVHHADGTIVISHDVREQMRQERMPAEADRLFVVENGTDHLRGDEAEEFPAELMRRGWAATQFLVVLGADYSHKNRDLAVDVWRRLRDRGYPLGLVFAGVAVARGSSRVLEARKAGHLDDIISLPDVTSEERNWLLRHATLCLYPTAAEGFGLVPFEAARFGTATVHASFGPLAEILPDQPVAAEAWDPDALADAAEKLLADPALCARQVEVTLANGDRYTWDTTAERLVEAYRTLLSMPPR